MKCTVKPIKSGFEYNGLNNQRQMYQLWLLGERVAVP